MRWLKSGSVSNMTKLLISGSRHWRNPQPVIAYVNRAVQRAVDCRHDIIVGDALGVDEWVCQAARDLGYQSHTFVYGLADKPRNGGCGFYFNTGFGRNGGIEFDNYHVRDGYMVDMADVVLCVWNGSSKGTWNVYDHASCCGKEAHLVQLENMKNVAR